MKKVVLASLFGLLLSSHVAFSTDLNVELRNLGSGNCNLVKSVLIRGWSTNIPSILAATGEPHYFILRDDNHKAEIFVTYQCNEQKKFTLHMSQYYKRNHHHTTITAEMLGAVGASEEHTRSRGMGSGPGKLSWRIF
jgi:hypothetical protein